MFIGKLLKRISRSLLYSFKTVVNDYGVNSNSFEVHDFPKRLFFFVKQKLHYYALFLHQAINVIITKTTTGGGWKYAIIDAWNHGTLLKIVAQNRLRMCEINMSFFL